jgi:hypothetical protein
MFDLIRIQHVHATVPKDSRGAAVRINEFSLAIYNQIAPNLMRWYQLLRTKTHKKMDKNAKPTP